MKKRILSLFLAVCLVLSFTGTAFAEGTLGSFTDASSARAGILCYYAEKNKTLTGWEELAALKTAGADLTLFSLPATDRVNSSSSATDIANAIICELMKGYRPTELTDLLLSKQNPAGSGKFSALTNGQIWAMTALNAAGASYPGPAAAQYLLLMQLPDGGFSYNGTAEAGTDADTTGAAAVAIKPFLASDELKTAENQTRIQKMKDYLKNTQQSDGTYASWGTKNASSTASAIWGLSALGENLSDYNKDGHTVTDGLLSFITKEEDGGKTYGYAYDYDWSTATPTAKVSTFSAYYTRQTLIALNDIINGESTYANLSKYIDGYKYRTVTVRAGNLVNLKLTAKSGENCELTAKDAVLQAFAKAAVPVSIAGGKVESVNGEAPAAGTEWQLFVNGRREAFDYKTGDGDSLELLLESTEYNTVSDLTGSASGTPREITVEAGTQNARVRVQPGTALPEISVLVADGGLSLLIPQNTKVTSSDGLWDGGIVLPRLAGNASIPGATVDKTISAGVQGKTLTFDRPVRLLIPGGAGKTAAYLDASGNPVRIDSVIGADNVTSAEEKLASTGKTEGRIDVGSDTAVWTKHFTTFVSYSESGGEGSDAGSVTLTVLGFNGQKILDSKSIKLSSGDTPISVLQKSGLSVTVKSGYVKTINGLSEFDHGADSGWMYGVNGIYPKTGAETWKLKDGDGVCWKYTNDGGTDIGAGTGEETETLIGTKQDCADKLELIKAALAKKSELSAWELYALCASGVKADAAKLG
ncbi:MAG: DUF4430 domain-containing protein, partial [Bacillota bacterium]|nr:DUF4430 domain-containing protein [Bacillota bacterium]